MKRGSYILTAGVALLAIAGSARPDITPRLIWNMSASVPPGLYMLRPGAQPVLGDLVVVAPPEPLAGFLAERGYLAPGVPLLKHVAALLGQKICRVGNTVTVDGREVAEAQARDRMGRELPIWQGCRALGRGEIFLLNRNTPDSLDGRYFGPLPA